MNLLIPHNDVDDDDRKMDSNKSIFELFYYKYMQNV